MKKKVIYKRLTIEGFQSVSKTLVFEFDRAGVNLIKGVNGKGKSTIFNALLWAEYGINLKKSVATWPDKRTKEYRGTRVVVERTDGEFDYMIVRHLEFKGTTKKLTGGDKLMIFKKDLAEPKFEQRHLLGDGQHKAEMQSMIEAQLGIDSDTYLNSILFGQRMKSLVETDPKDKRNLFDKLFDVGFVDEAKERAKTKKSALNLDIATQTAIVNNSSSKLTADQELVKEQRELEKTFKIDQQAAIDELTELKEEDEKRLAEIPDLLAKHKADLAKYDFNSLNMAISLADTKKATLSTAQDKLKNINSDIADLEKEVEKSVKNQAALQQELDEVVDTCPTCKGKLKKTDVDVVKASIKTKIGKEKEVQTTLGAKVSEAKAKKEPCEKEVEAALKNYTEQSEMVNTIRKRLEGSDDLKASITKLETEVKTLETSIKSLTGRITKEQDRKPTLIDFEAYGQRIAETTDALLNAQNKKAELENTLAKVEWWLTKGFGSSGIKAFVFNAMLAGLNHYAQKYAARLGFRVEFSVDMTKVSKPFQMLIYSKDKVRDYADLSGGQKQRVDVCIAFAMHDLVSFKTDINIVLLDEVFEGLDNEGVETAFELIRQKAETKAVYVITHSDIIDGLNCKNIWVSSDEDESTIIE